MLGLKKIAAIDVGSYTARMLVAAFSGKGSLQPLKKSRVYTRLAENFIDFEDVLSPVAMERTMQALNEFRLTADYLEADAFRTVCTGVVRRAKNREIFLEKVKQSTGLSAEIISGKTEACLTAKGVLSKMSLPHGSWLIFDLGGGTTEFIFDHEFQKRILSLDLGAAILTERYLRSDPPRLGELDTLEKAVDQMIEQAFTPYVISVSNRVLIGTGGTITTLAAMLNRIHVEAVGPEKIQGALLDIQNLQALWARLRFFSFDQRKNLTGLDENRAKVIIAGLLIILRIMNFFKTPQIKVSFNDLLEGIILDFYKGACHEGTRD